MLRGAHSAEGWPKLERGSYGQALKGRPSQRIDELRVSERPSRVWPQSSPHGARKSSASCDFCSSCHVITHVASLTTRRRKYLGWWPWIGGGLAAEGVRCGGGGFGVSWRPGFMFWCRGTI